MPKVEFSTKYADVCDAMAIDYAWFYSDTFFEEGEAMPPLPGSLAKEIKEHAQEICDGTYFPEDLLREFKKYHDPAFLRKRLAELEPKWRLVEERFFAQAERLAGRKFPPGWECVLAAHGQSFYMGGRIVLNVRDHPHPYIITHELVHTLIEQDIQDNHVDQFTKERIVDSYIARTPLKKLFPDARMQDENIRSPVDEIFGGKDVAIDSIVGRLK